MAFTILIMIHVLICIGLIIVVLMQSAKGEGLAGAFGGGGMSGAVFGGRGAASFLSKATTILAVAFMLSCVSLSFLSKGRSGSTADTSGSSLTESAQQDIQQQQQQAQEQQEQQGQGNAEDIFNQPQEGAAADSQ